MARRNRSKAKNNKPKVEAKNQMIEAAAWSPNRHFSFAPMGGNDRNNISSYEFNVTTQRARSLYYNFSEVRGLVKILSLLTGTLQFRPASTSEEFNNRAKAHLEKIFKNSNRFSSNKRLDFYTLQEEIEKKAIVDGDCLITLQRSNSGDGSARVQLYSSDQLTGGEANRSGVVLGNNGQIKSFILKNDNGENVAVSADRAFLYSHTAGNDVRGISELVACINTAQDLREIDLLAIARQKASSSIAFWESKSVSEQNSLVNDIVSQRRAKLNGEAQQEAPQQPPLFVNGSKVLSLEPGRELKMLESHNPTNEAQSFAQKLTYSLARSQGLPSQILWNPESLGSGATRYMLGLIKDWRNTRLSHRVSVMQKIYQYFLACEINSGRLSLPENIEDYDSIYNVDWIAPANYSIDLRHDAKTIIDLYNNGGFADIDKYCLNNFGMSAEELMNRKAHLIKHAKAIAEKYEIPIESLINVQGAAPVPWAEENEIPLPEDSSPEDSEVTKNL